MTRVDKWIESRLWNYKIEGRKISTVEIIQELSGWYNLHLDDKGIRRLKQRIRKVRIRVNTRFCRYNQRIIKLAKELTIPNNLVRRWVIAGYIDISNGKSLNNISRMFIERDYVKTMSLDDISLDTTDKLWS